MRSLLLALGVAASSAVLLGQVPGRNVNMVSGRTLPTGDPFLQRQNEPSVAASTRNPLHLLAGANDYRTVDLPGLANSNETGDAWMGVFKSYDGGNSWRSTLIPGYPQDAGSTSPLRAYKAAADPVVRAGSNGLFYYSGIVFDRSEPAKSALFVSRFIDNNNQEAGDPIVFLDTKLVTTNPGTAFIDKPWFAVDIPRANAPTCSITTTQKSPTTTDPDRTITTTQRFPGGAAYIAFSLITGEEVNDTRSQIYLSRSLDCGATWSAPQQISASIDPINQGVSLAIDPRNGTVYLAWRRFSADGTDDSIMVTRSIDQGRKWDPPGRARRFPRGRKVGLSSQMHGKNFKKPVDLGELASLDQPTGGDQFRTNAYPTMAIDGTGRVYVAWSERGFAPLRPSTDDGDARLLITSSTDGTTWTAPSLVANDALAGHQVMPALSFAGGKLMIAYYDFREDVAQVFEKFVDDQVAPQVGKRHTVDVRAAIATPAATPVFAASVRVSDYLMGSRPGYGPRPVEQLQFNPPNLKLFRTGTVPFFGDYIDLTPSPSMVPTAAGGWAFNTAPASSPLFHVVWTDNRDVVPPADGNWANYTPVGSTGGASSYDPTQPLPACVAGNEGMRNQNIYTARVTGGLVAGSPGNSKPLSPTLPRAFVVFAQNATNFTKTFRFTVLNQPTNGRASFLQASVLPPFPAVQTVLDVIVPARSTVVRNVYAISSDPHAQINVSVTEISAVGGTPLATGLQGTVVLNPDISNPDISNPDISNPDISNPDISNAEVSNPDISNPDISNPDISNPDISNPDISNPDISNGSVANPDISNPDISNPDISNPDISNPDISNPDISNPDISNQSLQDTTWTVTNNGNTTSAYSVKLLLNGTQPTANQVAVQLILRKVYTTPFALNCSLGTQAHNVLLANIPNPTFTSPADVNNPDISNPSVSNATLWLAPGETAKVTLRVRDLDTTDGITLNPAQQVTPAVVAQALDVQLVNGTLVVSADEPIAQPPTNNLQVQLSVPRVVAFGAPVGTIGVRVSDQAGAVVPGAAVAVSLHAVPGDTQVTQTTTVTTTADGTGSLNIGVLKPGIYQARGRVSSPGFEPIVGYSNAFTVLPDKSTVFTVTNTANSGPGSLSQALLSANANPGPDVIHFALGTGGRTISLTSRLPVITDPVTIDATAAGSCDGSAPAVEVTGAILDFSGPGLLVTAGNSTIRGIAVTAFSGNGIELSTAGNNRVECSYVGLALDGTTAKGNSGNGIQVSDGNGNFIGGVAATMGNTIAANAGEGVRFDRSDSNLIQNNRVGTSAAADADRGNGASGIYLRRSSSNLVLNNVVSGNNGFAGIAICGNLTFCGGGADTGTNNAGSNVVQGNLVGTNANGANLGNSGIGISVDSASNTAIGMVPGLEFPTGSPNVVSFNGSGIRIFGVGAINNRVSQNSIDGNAGLGLDLDGDGITANDNLDADQGSNNRQNFPIVTIAENTGNNSTLFQGTLHSTPNTAFVIELFNSATCDASGNGEGQRWVVTVTGISTDANGDLLFNAGVGPSLQAGTVITATATDLNGNTSEFSPCRTIDPAPVPAGIAGGTGGTPFGPFSCPAGSVATALRGRAGDDIDRTELWCTPAGSQTAVFAGGVGGNGGTDYDTALTCPAGSAMTGLHGQAGLVTFNNGGQAVIVDTLGVTCTSPTGAVFTSREVGLSANTPPFTIACPAGKRVVEIFGGQGGLLERIGISCR